MANETGAGNFVDSYLGKHETYGTREQFEKGEGIEPYAFDTAQYYDAERGGFVDPKGSMTPQYTNPFWETVGTGGLDPILNFFQIPKGWRGKVDPRTGDAYRTTGMDKVLVGQNINPAGLLTGGAKGLVSAASTKLPTLIAMAPVLWQGTTKAFRGQPSLEFVGSAKRGLAFGWGQYFSDRRSIAGGYTSAREFAIDGVTLGKLWNQINKRKDKIYSAWDKLLTKAQKTARRDTGKPLPWETPEYIALANEKKHLEDQATIFMFINLHGGDWERVLRNTYAGKYDPRQAGKRARSLTGQRKTILPQEEIDRLVEVGKDLWSQVVQTKGGSVHKWDVADELIGARGEKLLDWHVKFKDHPKEIQDKIIAALESLSTPTLLTGKSLQERMLRLRLDDVLETIHSGGTRFRTATGEKYLPKPLTEEMIRRDALNLMTGEDIYNLIRRDIPTAQSKGTWKGLEQANKAASLHLGEHGLDGLRYQANTLMGKKAAGTWDADVTRNYVIWSQKLLDQMERLGTY